MSNYTKTTNFGAKDTLPSGDSQKIIRGTEFDTEFNNIATAVATKLEVDGSNNLAISGTFSSTKLIPTGGTAIGNGMYLPAANAVAISTNGTERLRIDSSGVASFASNPILNGGTANGLVYLDGSKVATSGSAVTFDGTNLATTGTASATKLIPTGGTATGNGLYLPAANTLALSTNGVERVRVDSSGNLGIGTTSPGVKLQVVGTISSQFAADGSNSSGVRLIPATTGEQAVRFITADGNPRAAITGADVGFGPGVMRFYVNNPSAVLTEHMRLDDSGNLGVGTASPAFKLHVVSSGTTVAQFTGQEYGQIRHSDGTRTLYTNVYNNLATLATESNTPLAFGTNNTERARIDSSGNFGLGVTPSAWSGGFKATQYPGGSVASYASGTNLQIEVGNAYYQSSLGTYAYYNTGTAPTLYRQISGEHRWLTAPSGTAGNAITFTQAMTLDASGNLGVGSTAPVGYSGYSGVTIQNTNGGFINLRNAANTNQMEIAVEVGNTGYVKTVTSIPLIFGTNNTERARIKSTGQLRFVPLSADPAGAETGDVYYNSTSNKLKVYNGTAWVDLH